MSHNDSHNEPARSRATSQAISTLLLFSCEIRNSKFPIFQDSKFQNEHVLYGFEIGGGIG